MQLTEVQALELWRRTIVAGVRHDVPDLSARQMAVLLTVYLKSPPHTVRGLASALNISKPAITRGLDRLSDLGLVRRKVDESDRRSVLIQRTLRGSVFLREYGEIIVDSGHQMDDRHDLVDLIPFEAAISGGMA
jgi:DNA-binding MarR family transcriptional regulator